MPRVGRAPNGGTDLVVAIDSFSAMDEGVPFTIPQGYRLRRTHPIVRAHPSLFVSADLPDNEIEAARRAYYAETMAHARS